MDMFFIDNVGDTSGKDGSSYPVENFSVTYDRDLSSTHQKATQPVEESSDDDDYGGLPPPTQRISKILKIPRAALKQKKVATCNASAFTPEEQPSSSKGKRRVEAKVDRLSQTDVEKEMKSAVLTPGIEKKQDISRLAMSDETLRKLNRAERSKTKGKNWFDLPAPELTDEMKNELQLLRMRSVLDTKQSFKRLEKRKLPKYFEVGKVLESPVEHYNERGVKKLKSKSLVDELLADAEFQKFNKRKFAESLEKQKKKAYHKAVMKMKREKRNKKKKK